jgi:hypothetical protein
MAHGNEGIFLGPGEGVAMDESRAAHASRLSADQRKAETAKPPFGRSLSWSLIPIPGEMLRAGRRVIQSICGLKTPF